MRFDCDVTGYLRQWHEGDEDALNQLFHQTYQELKVIARSQFRGEHRQVTLQPTALLHEVYLRLHRHQTPLLANRQRFFSFAAHVMRQVLVDLARARGSDKRGNGLVPVALEDHEPSRPTDPDTLLAIDQALSHLAELDPDKSRVLELWYFGGLTSNEIAQIQNVSRATAKRHLRAAKLWVLAYLPKTAGNPVAG
ncbi:ECF-type sigma factor [Acanthopleuribacter pedis]|uniref:Sigma-70 family RNA polymerase sigma factor n=1 Tax=Acanthopleuribacter pedis TaxID=442870 RepID=A0A8J7QA41_9BACT|nr:ECF-type sigma factor [Acanthopleuribacter pedis]MBO1320607.1 sigma-70 family RNA polymerase sigma factor [Acanthopleuribacter pedis]